MFFEKEIRFINVRNKRNFTLSIKCSYSRTIKEILFSNTGKNRALVYLAENQKLSKGKGGYRLIEIETTIDNLENDCQKGEPTGMLANDLVKDKIKIVGNSDLTEVFGWFANFSFKRQRT